MIPDLGCRIRRDSRLPLVSHVFFRNDQLAELLVLLSDQLVNGAHGLGVFGVADVHFELEHVEECVRHYSHLPHVEARDYPEEDRVFLVAVEAKLRSEGHRDVQHALSISFRQGRAPTLQLLEEAVDVDEGCDHDVRSYVLVALHEELNEFLDLDLAVEVLAMAVH